MCLAFRGAHLAMSPGPRPADSCCSAAQANLWCDSTIIIELVVRLPDLPFVLVKLHDFLSITARHSNTKS